MALVTGGVRGIGRAIAIELARTHRLIATYRGRRDVAETLAAETGADCVQSDVASREDRAGLVQRVRERYGQLDLLVNNAGISPRQRVDVLETSEDSYDELLAINLKGPHFLTQQLAPLMMERASGRIVFVTSISSFTATVSRAEYCISKAGLSMSAALFAARLAAHGIGVFEIRPGIIRTEMIAPREQHYEKRIADGMLPQRRMGEPEDVARAVRAIADGQLDYCAGQILNVDGGFHLRTL